MAGLPVTTFVRIRPDSLIERDAVGSESVVVGPPDFLAQLKPKVGIVVAGWDPAMQLGCASRLGIVVELGSTGAKVRWATTDATYRPNPAGRRYWVQQKPFFGFAADVAKRYMLAAEFVEKFPDAVIFEATRAPAHKSLEVKPTSSPTGGYVYLVRSQYGIKIGKSVNVKSRTRLFEVKLPFPITVEHFAWFDDYSRAERDLHLQYHEKRLEGEWFDLTAADVAHIRTLGKPASLSMIL